MDDEFASKLRGESRSFLSANPFTSVAIGAGVVVVLYVLYRLFT